MKNSQINRKKPTVRWSLTWILRVIDYKEVSWGSKIHVRTYVYVSKYVRLLISSDVNIRADFGSKCSAFYGGRPHGRFSNLRFEAIMMMIMMMMMMMMIIIIIIIIITIIIIFLLLVLYLMLTFPNFTSQLTSTIQ